MTKPTLLLDAHLKALRLPTLLREYDKVARHGAQEGLDCPRYLFRLCELELLDREPRAVERRIKAAKFPVLKSLETFEFPAIPSLNKRLVLELARSEYLDRRENVLALGNSGTGKTHLALAVGLAACQQGYRVRFTTAAALVNDLLEARDDKRLLRLQKQLAKQDLLIVDELGYVPLSKTTAERCSRSSPSARECSAATVNTSYPTFCISNVVVVAIQVCFSTMLACVGSSSPSPRRPRPTSAAPSLHSSTRRVRSIPECVESMMFVVSRAQ